MGLDETTLDRISAWQVQLDLKHGFRSAQAAIQARRVVLVRIEAGGVAGWGEAAPVPGHGSEEIGVLWATLQSLLGEVALDAADASTGLLRAAFNQASDDIAARRADLPLWKSLGGEQPVVASAAIGVNPEGQPDQSQVESAAADGYRNAKLKITPQTDAAFVADLVRNHPAVTFGADANCSLHDQGALLTALDRIGLEYIEQPGQPNDLDWHTQLRRQLDTPISLDESAHSAVAVERIVAAGAADIVNLKVGRFGTRATLDLATRAAARGIRVRLGGLIESGVGRAHTIALVAHPVFTVVGDIAGSDRYFVDDLVRPQWRVANGHLELPSAPGIGVDIDETALDRSAIDHVTVG